MELYTDASVPGSFLRSSQKEMNPDDIAPEQGADIDLGNDMRWS